MPITYKSEPDFWFEDEELHNKFKKEKKALSLKYKRLFLEKYPHLDDENKSKKKHHSKSSK